MPLLRERLEQPNKQPNSFPASTGQDSCRRAVRIVDIDHKDYLQRIVAALTERIVLVQEDFEQLEMVASPH
jgi:hypothetical protein